MKSFFGALVFALLLATGVSAASYKIKVKADITEYNLSFVSIYGLQKPWRLPESSFNDGGCDSIPPAIGDDCYTNSYWDVADVIKSFRFEDGPADLTPSGRVKTRGQIILQKDLSVPGGYKLAACRGILYLGCSVRPNDPPEHRINVVFDPANPQGLFIEAEVSNYFWLVIENAMISTGGEEFGSARTPFGFLTYNGPVYSEYATTSIKVRDLSQVPLPVGAWFLISGLAAFGLTRRRSGAV